MTEGSSAKRILWISNGSGEDWIGAELARAWQRERPQDHCSALALVGEGRFYRQAGIALRPISFQPPSQGFAYLHPGKLWHDFRAGLGAHVYRALADLHRLRGHWDYVIAVGDIVSVLAASWSQTPYAFVACALSDWYIEPNPHGRTCWDPLQLQLLRPSQAPVFPRDSLTTRHVQARGLRAFDCGNPMVQAYSQVPLGSAEPVIAVLPGSHRDAVANLGRILSLLAECGQESWHLQLLQAPQISAAVFEACLQQWGWQQQGDAWHWHKLRLSIVSGAQLPEVLQSASAAIGLAGTANEQCVAAGLPVVAFVTQGDQYTAAFAEAQQRLLGPGLHLLEPVNATLMHFYLRRVLSHPAYRQAAQQVAAERFGPVGAAARIVSRLRQEWHV